MALDFVKGRPLEAPADMNVYAAMEDVMEKLKLLNFEEDFLPKYDVKRTHFTRLFFAIPTPGRNHAEQFDVLSKMIHWACSLCDHHYTCGDELTDPNTKAMTIIEQMQALGFAINVQPAKLKQGHGDHAVATLNGLLDVALEYKGFRWEPILHPADEEEEEAADDQGDDADNLEIDDDIQEEEPESNPFDDLQPSSDAVESSAVVESSIDPAEWKLELERVGPQLAVTSRVMGASGDKEWRAHLETTKAHQAEMQETLPESSEKISKLGVELEGTLEKIQTRERVINSQFEHIGKEFAVCKDELKATRAKYDASTKTVTRQQNILQTISDELDEVKSMMDNTSDTMNDASPVVLIKEALARIKKEIRQMELRIGVSEHSLTHARLKSKTASMLKVGDDGQYESIRGPTPSGGYADMY